MGFNISGIVIENNFKEDIQKVSENLEIGFEIIKECESYEATESINENDNIFICFTKSSTIIFYEPGHFDKHIYSQSLSSLNFLYLEGPMMFGIRYVKDCEIIRNVLSIDGKIIYSTGTKLKAEVGTQGVDEIVVNLAKQISGITILGISEQTKVTKCRIVDYVGKRIRKSEVEIDAIITERRISRNFSSAYDEIF
jgi:hypothetical protein